jgi:hypothetical protein
MYALSHLRVATFLGFSLVTNFTHAGDFWTRPQKGVLHLHRTSPGIDLHVVLVNLRDPAVSVVATRPQDRFITTSEFAHRYNAQVAMNANFFDRSSCGLAVGGGETFTDAYDDGCNASLGFGNGHTAMAFDSQTLTRGPVPESWVSEVITGKPWLMRNGRGAGNWLRPQHIYRPNPRSVAGITADGGTLALLAADGRRSGVQGLNGFEMLDVMREFQISDAVNLDGGGSTALVVNHRIVNKPSDRGERRVATHIGVRVAATQQPAPASPTRTPTRASLSFSHPMSTTPQPGHRAPSRFAWSVLATFGTLLAAMKVRKKS